MLPHLTFWSPWQVVKGVKWQWDEVLLYCIDFLTYWFFDFVPNLKYFLNQISFKPSSKVLITCLNQTFSPLLLSILSSQSIKLKVTQRHQELDFTKGQGLAKLNKEITNLSKSSAITRPKNEVPHSLHKYKTKCKRESRIPTKQVTQFQIGPTQHN